MKYLNRSTVVSALVSITACGFSPSVGSSAPCYPVTPDVCSPYLNTIQTEAQRLPWDWLWVAAQVYQESRCDPRALSPTGAMGLMQIMPGTWREMTRAMRIDAHPYSPRHNIAVGVAYDERMRRVWRADRSEDERRLLALASYNAGAGNIIRAQRECGGARYWPHISPCLRSVTGRHADETITYVDRITGYRSAWASSCLSATGLS